jgi:hypothetical protein
MRHTLRVLGVLERRIRQRRRGTYDGPMLVVDAMGMAPDERARAVLACEAEVTAWMRRTRQPCPGPIIILDA